MPRVSRPRPRDRGRAVLRAARPDRRRQDDDAAPDRRARAAGLRRHLHRPPERRRLERRRSATWRSCCSNTRSIPRYTVRENLEFPLKSRIAPICPEREIDERVARAAADRAGRASARSQDRPAVGRRDAARLDRPRDRAPAAHLPDGRAAVQPRRQAARGACAPSSRT